jgi:hypothetical protein
MNKFHLHIPFADKDEVKQRFTGQVRWDPEAKSWYTFSEEVRSDIQMFLDLNDIARQLLPASHEPSPVGKPSPEESAAYLNDVERIFIDVPFKFKDQVKAAFGGVFWSKQDKSWYVLTQEEADAIKTFIQSLY